MEIEITDFPESIKSFFFSPKKILSDKLTVDYLGKMKKYIFGTNTCSACEKLGISVFDLVFINEKPLYELCGRYIRKVKEREKDPIRTAVILRSFHKSELVRISDVIIGNEKAFIKDPEIVKLKITPENTNIVKPSKNKKPNDGFNKKAQTVLESVRLSALKYGMNYAIRYKELIDKYNYRRFSSNLKINNRPASVEEIVSIFSSSSEKILTDLSNPKVRVIYSVLFAMAYGGFTLPDIYSKNTVFEVESFDKEKRLGDLACDFINIVYNGNRMEIANVFIDMILSFVNAKMPAVNMNDLGSIMDNYTMYYAAASIASVCENIYNYNGFNADMKEYLKKQTFTNYWTINDRIMLVKQYSSIISFCYKMSQFDYKLYLEDPEYQAEILYSFESSAKFSEELKKIG
ncbi:MAG: hypothetical protein II820_01510 [Ruminiclostridium sp.]|nr:hypothetical protein [Ruminiclostridium sp.]